jgi:hypothetical protein
MDLLNHTLLHPISTWWLDCKSISECDIPTWNCFLLITEVWAYKKWCILSRGNNQQ